MAIVETFDASFFLAMGAAKNVAIAREMFALILVQ